MTNAYKYSDFVNNVKNKQPKNAEYCKINDLAQVPMRATDILIQPTTSNFEPFTGTDKTHIVTISYPTTITKLTYENTNVAYTQSGSTKTSKITVPEYMNGTPYYAIIKYSPNRKISVDGTICSGGQFRLGQITYDRTINISNAYSFNLSSDNNIDYIVYSRTSTIGNSTDENTLYLPAELTLSVKTVYIDIHCKSGYIVNNVTGSNCTVTAMTGNKYKITYNGDNIVNSMVNVTTKEEEIATYYSVAVTGLENASVMYNSTTLGETDGTAIINNIVNDTSVAISINADPNYRITQIKYGTHTETYNNVATANLTIPISNSNVTVECTVVLYYRRLNFAQNDNLAEISCDGDSWNPSQAEKDIYVRANQTTISFTLTPKSGYSVNGLFVAPEGVVTGTSSGNTYTLTVTDNTAPTIKVYYDVSIADDTVAVTFKNVKNCTIKRGTALYKPIDGTIIDRIPTNEMVIFWFEVDEGYSMLRPTVSPDSTDYDYNKSGYITIYSSDEDITIVINTQQVSTASVITTSATEEAEEINDDTVVASSLYDIYIVGADNAYAFRNESLLPVQALNSQLFYVVEGVSPDDEVEITFQLTEPTGYEFVGVPISSDYSITWNSESQKLTIKNVNKTSTVTVNIQKKAEATAWETRAFYIGGSQTYNTKKWNKTALAYEHSTLIQANEVTSWICFDFKTNNDYKIITSSNNIEYIYMYRSSSLIELKDDDIQGRIILEANRYKTDDGYLINASVTGNNTSYNYIYFAFTAKEDSNENLIVSDVVSRALFSPLSDFDDSGIFRSSDVSDFHMILECDPTAETIPYSQLSFKVYDEDNSFKLSDFEAQGNNNYTFGTPYNVYALSAQVTGKMAITDSAYYAVQIGRFFLDNVSYDNDYILFTFIGAIEYYDKIYLSAKEKRLSRYYDKISVCDYIKQLFGSDVDVNGIPTYFTSLTPFENESKSEILRILCEYCNLTMFEGADGKIHFSGDKTANTPATPNGLTAPFKMSLDNSTEFTTFERKNKSYDSVTTDIRKRGKSETKKLMENINYKLYIKNDSVTDEWEDDIGWNLYMSGSDQEDYVFYDKDGSEYTGGLEFGDSATKAILSTHGDIEYCKFSFVTDIPMSDMSITASSLIRDKIGVIGFSPSSFIEFLMERYFIINPSSSGSSSDIKVYYSDKGFEIYFKFPIKRKNSGYDVLFWILDVWADNINQNPDNTFANYIFSNPGEIDYMAILFDIWVSLAYVCGETTYTEVTESISKYAYSLPKTTNNTLQFDTSLITSRAEAILSANQALFIRNSLCMEACYNNWRGNGLIELCDNILFENSSGRNIDKRKYEQYHCGKVTKLEFDFDGALSMATTLRLPQSVYYSSINDNDEVKQVLSSSIAFVNNEIPLVKKT